MSTTNETLLSVTLAASVAAIEADHPAWQVWWVPVYTSGYLWCARRHSDPGMVLNASSAAQLRQRITDTGG